MDVIREGQSTPVETLYVGQNYTFRVWVANDSTLGGMQLPFRWYSPSGVSWDYVIPQTALSYVTVVPGCRMDPPATIWDMTDLFLLEKSMDGVAPDSLMMGGTAMYHGLPAGSLQAMLGPYQVDGGGDRRSGGDDQPGHLFCTAGGQPDVCDDQ